jgi:ankyrin repeat protein
MPQRILLSALLAALAAVASVNAAGGSPLIDAVKRQDPVAVRALLARHVDVNAADSDGSTALHWAVQRNDTALVRQLLKAGARARTATRYNVTPLHLAAVNGNRDIIEQLLDAGVDVNTPSLEGQTALMLAAAEGSTDVVGLLIEAGADVRAASTGGFTPLLFAVRNARLDTAKLLLQRGASANDVAPDGTSALGMAALNANFEVGSLLLANGADPNAKDPRGSILHTLAWLRKPGADGAAGVGNVPQGTPQQTGSVTAIELAAQMLDRGANPNMRVDWSESKFGKEGGTARNPPNIRLGRHILSYVGATPFYVAAKNGDAPMMRLLAQHGANPTMGTKAGVTPLMVASGLDYWEGESPGPFTGVTEAERLDAVKLAVQLGNDVNAQAHFGDYPMTGDVAYTLLYYPHNIDDLLSLGVGDPRWNGATPLIGAVVSGQPSIVRYLVAQGARLDAKTALGWTALDVAEGVFFANAKKEFPAAAAILKESAAR